MRELKIKTEYITLDSALKLANLVSTGGEAKNVIGDGLVEVNGAVCAMRGKKLRPGDRLGYGGERFVITGSRGIALRKSD